MQSNNGTIYFLIGAGVGAAVALLFAPKTGEDTRNYLQSRADDAAARLKEQGQRAMDVASEGVDRAKSMLRNQSGSVSDAIEAGKQAYRDTVEATS